jgi:uncharacterized protein YjiS (DUF1127 family)
LYHFYVTTRRDCINTFYQECSNDHVSTRTKSVLIDLNEAPSLPMFAQFAVVLAGVVTKWRNNARTRNHLSHLSDHHLRDVGLTRAAATRKAQLPFWK